MEPSRILLGCFIVKVKGGFVSQEVWHDRLSNQLISEVHNKAIFKRKNDCINATLDTNKGLPTFPSPIALRKYLESCQLRFSEGDIARLYEEVVLQYDAKANKAK